MKTFIAIFVLTILALTGCQSAPPKINTGFLAQKDLPETISQRQADVLKIEVAASFEIPADQVFDRQMRCLKQADKQEKYDCDQIQKCAKNKVCHYERLAGGTGFIDETTGLLITARHVIADKDEDTADLMKLAGRLNIGNFYIFDQKSQILFSTRVPTERIFSIKEPCQNEQDPKNERTPFRCDVVGIRLSKSLKGIRPFHQGAPAAEGDASFALGYPSETTWQLTGAQLNSNGKDLFILAGTIGDERQLLWKNRETLATINPELQSLYEQYGNRLFSTILNSREFTDYFLQDMIAIQGIAIPGMSGGPILNLKGEWIGLTNFIMGLQKDFSSRITYPYSKGISAEFVVQKLKQKND
jgi:hypothetical protein